MRRPPLGTRHALRDYDFSNEELNGRRAGDSMTANRIEAEFLIVGVRKTRDRDGRLRCYLRRRPGHCNVPGVADLAMLFVGGVAMPVPCSLHGKQAHGKNQGHRQQS